MTVVAKARPTWHKVCCFIPLPSNNVIAAFCNWPHPKAIVSEWLFWRNGSQIIFYCTDYVYITYNLNIYIICRIIYIYFLLLGTILHPPLPTAPSHTSSNSKMCVHKPWWFVRRHPSPLCHSKGDFCQKILKTYF